MKQFINQILAKFKSDSGKEIFTNIISLSILQISKYVFPLITFPYLVRVLGAERFGLLAFAQAFVQYFILITDYGFNLTATRQISINRSSRDKISNIFWSVMAARLALVMLSALVLAGIVFSVPKFRADWTIYFITFISVPGNALFPVWFFQGLEKMKYITALTILARTITLALIFVFVHKQSDYLLAAGLQSAGLLLSGIIGLLVAQSAFPIILKAPSFDEIRSSLAEGWQVFISQISITLFSTSNTFILGLFASNQQVGYFAIADKTVRAFVSLIAPLSTALYPRISSMFVTSRERTLHLLRKILFLGGAAFFTISLLLYFGADVLTYLVTGGHNHTITVLIRILAILPFTIFVVNILGTQIMLNINMQSHFMKIMIATGFFAVTYSFLTVPFYGEFGTATASLSAEILEMVLMIIIVQKSGVYLFKNTQGTVSTT